MINMRIHEILFQLTPSRRATFRGVKALLDDGISTHALTEGDSESSQDRPRYHDFNSRPHGGRRNAERTSGIVRLFQLTPSRRATVEHGTSRYSKYFNSRPHGGRRNTVSRQMAWSQFQLTPSRRATKSQWSACRDLRNFNSRPHGGRPWLAQNTAPIVEFQLTPSRRATANLDKFFF